MQLIGWRESPFLSYPEARVCTTSERAPSPPTHLSGRQCWSYFLFAEVALNPGHSPNIDWRERKQAKPDQFLKDLKVALIKISNACLAYGLFRGGWKWPLDTPRLGWARLWLQDSGQEECGRSQRPEAGAEVPLAQRPAQFPCSSRVYWDSVARLRCLAPGSKGHGSLSGAWLRRP